MKSRARAGRRLLRDRRRYPLPPLEHGAEILALLSRARLVDRRLVEDEEPPIFTPLTGFDLYLAQRYGVHVNRCTHEGGCD